MTKKGSFFVPQNIRKSRRAKMGCPVCWLYVGLCWYVGLSCGQYGPIVAKLAYVCLMLAHIEPKDQFISEHFGSRDFCLVCVLFGSCFVVVWGFGSLFCSCLFCCWFVLVLFERDFI